MPGGHAVGMNPSSDAVTVGIVAGYRVVRRIGSGGRSVVFLGHAVTATLDGADAPARVVALKVMAADALGQDASVRALLTATAVGLPAVLDVATTPDDRLCVVLEHVAGPTVLDLLASGRTLSAGEAVTLLATVVAAVQALHEAGFGHSAVSQAVVRLDGNGRPVLLGLGAIDELPPGVAGLARRRDDQTRLAGFVRAVLEQLDPADPATAGAHQLLADFEAATVARPFVPALTDLEAALFSWSAAGAVRWPDRDRAEPNSVPTVSATAVPAVPAVRAGADRTAPVWPDPGSGRDTRSGRFDALARAGEAAVDGLRTGLIGLRRSMSARWGVSRRPRARAARRWVRPAVLGAITAVALSVTGALMIPANPTGSGAGEPGSARTASGSPDSDVPETESPSVTDPALTGDDPAAAASALLRLRAECLSRASVRCLAGVHQPGSVALVEDAARVRREQQEVGAAPPVSGAGQATASHIERTGNAAVVEFTPSEGSGLPPTDGFPVAETTQPAVALIIKGEAGWRIRELFGEGPNEVVPGG